MPVTVQDRHGGLQWLTIHALLIGVISNNIEILSVISRGLSATAELLVHCPTTMRSRKWNADDLTYRTYVCRCQLFLPALLSAPRLVETWSSLAPDDVSRIEHSASPVLRRGTVCRRTFVLHQHSVLSKICSRLICFFIHFNINLIPRSVCCTAPS